MMIHGIFNKKGYGKEYFMNKRKDEFDNLRDNVNKTFQLLYEMRYKFVKENKLLQERIDKAIEYVEFVKSYSLANTLNEGYIDVDKLLNILKGVNNE